MQGGEIVLTRIEDYASYGDLLWPSLIRTLDPAGNETVLQLEDLEIDPEFDAAALFSPPSDDVRDFEFLNGSDRAVIPIRIPVDHPFATVRIGDNSYQFVVDTGAGSTVLSSAVADELRLESLGTIRGQGVSGSQEVSFVAVPEFIVGDVAVRGQQVVAIDFSNLQNRLPEMDGLLGMDFLNRFVVRFDYVRGEMTVFERESFQYRGSGEEFNLDGIAFLMSVDGHAGKFRIDTGAPNLGLHAPFVRSLGMIRDRDAMPMTSVVSGVGSVELRSFHALCHEIRIGDFTLRDVPISLSEIETGAFANESILGNIGGLIWRKFISYFDFSAGRMILEPNSNYDDPFPLSKFGAGFKRVDGRYYVDSITTNSPAAGLGLQREDELLEFDGTPASSFRLDELQLKFRAPEGTRYPMKIRTPAGDERNVEAVLRNYHRYYDSY
jgi:predicted aspartyl protease